MPHQPSTQAAPETPRDRRRLAISVLAAGLFALVACLAISWLAYLLITGRPLPAPWPIQLALAAMATASTAGLLLHLYLHWARPTRRLLAELEQVRAGTLPIEDLSHIAGGPAPVVAAVQELLRDLRRQRAAFARLELELSQRVACRTEALERKLGTLMQQAARDPLTSLFNRRLLDEHLPRLVSEAVAAPAPLALLMLDIDRFKSVNDTLGHAAGDQLLADVGQLIRSSMRDTDLAFRYGGDEFVIVLPGHTAARARALADRLMSLMDRLAHTLRLPVPPALSVGIATLDDLPAPTPHTLLALADQRLYTHKQSRRPAA